MQKYFRNPDGAVYGVAGPHIDHVRANGWTEVDEATARTEVPELFGDPNRTTAA